MSGLEVVGLALGAFPIALLALEKHEEVARRVKLFSKIRLEHKIWVDDLRHCQITYARHLRRLLLPLIFDDDTVKGLLEDPRGDAWRNEHVEPLVRKRLLDAHELYFSYVEGVGRVMEEINEHLALSSAPIQDKLSSEISIKGKFRMKAALTKDGRDFQRYKLKFSNGQSVRSELFGRLRDYIEKMDKLLVTGDEESRLVQQRNLALEKTSVDSSLCTFWQTAKTLFEALASSWGCCCQQHDARLLLQHRDSRKTGFDITFVKCKESHWELHRTLVKGKTNASVGFSGGSTMVAIGEVEIQNLCEAFFRSEDDRCWFLQEEDTRYILHSISRCTVSRYHSTTLENILRRDGCRVPSRAKRLSLSLILASSFMQLLESPWISKPLSKTDVLFLFDPSAENGYRLDQPQLVKSLVPNPATNNPDDPDNQSTPPYNQGRWYTDALNQLGILLLELCFGETLEQQPSRMRWPAAGMEAEKACFDYLAAKEWRAYVNEEAGLDYEAAVDWCLWEHLKSTPETWRQDMLRRVIQPLQRCRDYLNHGSQR